MLTTAPSGNERFETLVLPWLPAAYNVARWLTRNRVDAEDVVQEAFLRAFKYFDSYQGGDVRAWLLQIVRNTAHTWLAANRPAGQISVTPDLLESQPAGDGMRDPAESALTDSASRFIRAAVAELPMEYREVLVLREFEELSYREIAAIIAAPIGTVMSRLSRARDQLAASVKATKRGRP